MSFTPTNNERALQDSFGSSNILGEIPQKLGYYVNFLGKKSVTDGHAGYILPAIDHTLDLSDSALLKAHLPFWSSTRDYDHKKHFVPNFWAVVVSCYAYLGPDNLHVMSPKTKKVMIGNELLTPEETADPLQDLRTWIRKHPRMSKEEKEYYTKSEYIAGSKDNRDPYAPGDSAFHAILSLAKNTKEKDYTPKVELIKPSAFQQLLKQARELNQTDDQVIDPAYPQYTFGDPSKPSGALLYRTALLSVDPTNPAKTANCLTLSEDGQTLDKGYANTMRVLSEADLAKRFVMWDPASWFFHTYQEIADIMVDQLEEVPLEFMKEACGHYADFPAERKVRAKIKPKDEDAEEDEEQETNAGINLQKFTEPQASATPAVPTSTPPVPSSTPPVPAAEMVTVAAAGGNPFEIPKANLQQYVGHYILEGTVWNPIVAVAAPAVPAVPAVPTTPAVPSVPSVPAVPPTTPLVAATTVGADAVLETRRSFIPDDTYERQQLEVKAECNSVAELIAGKKSTGAALDAEESARVAAVVGKIKY